MNSDLQYFLGLAAFVFALCSGIGACSYGVGAGIALKYQAERVAR